MNNNKPTNNAKSSETDALSDVLNLLKLNVNIYHNAKVCGDWRIDEHKLGATCFHIVTLDRCVMHVPDYESINLETGDLVIFPRELAHHILPLEKLSGKQQHILLIQVAPAT